MPISSGFELYFAAVRPENNNLARTAGNSSDVRYRHLGGLRGGGRRGEGAEEHGEKTHARLLSQQVKRLMSPKPEGSLTQR